MAKNIRLSDIVKPVKEDLDKNFILKAEMAFADEDGGYSCKNPNRSIFPEHSERATVMEIERNRVESYKQGLSPYLKPKKK